MSLFALFRLAFASASEHSPLTSRHPVTPGLIMQKARRQAFPLRGIALRLLVGVRFQVLFHSPRRGSFHLSLALLSPLSVAGEYLALRGGPRGFTPAFPGLVILGRRTQEAALPLTYVTITRYGPTFQWCSARLAVFSSPTVYSPPRCVPSTPNNQGL